MLLGETAMKKNKSWSIGVALAGLVGLCGHTASAAPIISVDVDPLTAGIQSTLTVAPSTMFTVDILISDDGAPLSPTVFDTVILEVSFNDSGAILAPGPTGPVAGALAGNSASTASVFGPAGSPVPGATVLTAGPSAPQPGFASGSGAIGFLDPLTFTVVPGTPMTIFSIDLTAGLGPGSSTILAAGTPPGSPELALAGVGIAASLVRGTVNVVAVPEPGTLLLFATGLLGMAVMMRRRRA